MASIILSIIASSRPSFSKFGSIYYRDTFTYMISINLMSYAPLATQIIVFLIEQATGCSEGSWSTIRKIIILIEIATGLCACTYSKERIASWVHSSFNSQPPRLPHCSFILAASHSLLTNVLILYLTYWLLLYWKILLQIMNHGGWQAVPLLQALRGVMHLTNHFWILSEERYPSPSVPGSDLRGEERLKIELHLVLASTHRLGTWREEIENVVRPANQKPIV